MERGFIGQPVIAPTVQAGLHVGGTHKADVLFGQQGETKITAHPVIVMKVDGVIILFILIHVGDTEIKLCGFIRGQFNPNTCTV